MLARRGDSGSDLPKPLTAGPRAVSPRTHRRVADVTGR